MTRLMLLLLSGCLLGGSPSTPVEVRYFSPEATHARAHPAGPIARLQLGQITASAHLRYRIVHQTSEVERRLSDTLHWTETPDVYIRRALARALLDDRALERSANAEAPTLDVEVTAFDDVVRAGQHVGRVELSYQLRDGDRVLAIGDVAEERPAATDDIQLIVRAIGAAMDAAVATLATQVSIKLTPR